MKIIKNHQEIIDQLTDRFQEQLKDECGEIAHELLNEESTEGMTDDDIMDRFNEIHHSLYREIVKSL